MTTQTETLKHEPIKCPMGKPIKQFFLAPGHAYTWNETEQNYKYTGTPRTFHLCYTCKDKCPQHQNEVCVFTDTDNLASR
jgi:hypothetical protein